MSFNLKDSGHHPDFYVPAIDGLPIVKYYATPAESRYWAATYGRDYSPRFNDFVIDCIRRYGADGFELQIIHDF